MSDQLEPGSDGLEEETLAEAVIERATRPGPRSFVTDAVMMMSSQVGHFGIQLIIGIAIARIWGADNRGLLTLAMVIPLFFTEAADLGLRKSIPRLIGQKIMPIRDVVSAGMLQWLVSSSVCVVAAISLLLFVPGVTKAPPVWFLVATILIPCTLFNNLSRAVALGVEDIGWFNQLIWINDPLILAIVVIGGWAMGLSPLTYIIAMVTARLTLAVYGAFKISRHAPLRLTRRFGEVWSMVRTGVIYSTAGVLMLMNYRLDVILLGIPSFHIQAGDIGNYTVGVAFANMLWQIPISLNQLLFSRSVNANDPMAFARKTARLLRFSLVMGTPGAVLLFIAAPILFPLIYGKDFALSATISRILLPGILAFCAARVIDADLTAKGRPWLMITVMFPVVLANLVLNLLWIPVYGVNGAAMASTLTYCGGAVALIIIYARVTHMGLLELVIPRREDFKIRIPGLGRGRA